MSDTPIYDALVAEWDATPVYDALMAEQAAAPAKHPGGVTGGPVLTRLAPTERVLTRDARGRFLDPALSDGAGWDPATAAAVDKAWRGIPPEAKAVFADPAYRARADAARAAADRHDAAVAALVDEPDLTAAAQRLIRAAMERTPAPTRRPVIEVLP